MAILQEAKEKSYQQKATVNWNTVSESTQKFMLEQSGKHWREQFIPVITGMVEEQGVKLNAAFGFEFDIRNVIAEEWYNDYVMPFARFLGEDTQGELSELLQLGMHEGWSIPKMEKHFKELYDTWEGDRYWPEIRESYREAYESGKITQSRWDWYSGARRNRAEMIARSETIRASNRGANELYRGWGVNLKEWYVSRDDRTCPLCWAMDGTVIDINGNFWNKGDTMSVQGEDRTLTLKFDYEDVKTPPLHPNCYDRITEVYTKTGWRLIGAVQRGERVLTLDPETKDLEWEEVVGTTSHREEKILEIRNKKHSLDMAVSKNHPFFGYKRVDHGNRGRVIEPVRYGSIKELPKSEFRFYLSSQWRGEKKDRITIAGRDMDTIRFVRFLAFYLSEGSVVKRYKDYYQISIAQTRFLDEMWDEIKDLPFDNVGLGQNKIYIYDHALGEYLIRFGKSHEKYVPEEVKELSPIYIKEFLDAYTMGDGHIKKGKKWKGSQFGDSIILSTSSKRMAADLGELIIKVGKSVSYQKLNIKGKKCEFANGTYTINHDVWMIFILNSRYRFFEHAFVTEVNYDDFVYDIEVPKNHTILTRRNGKVVWGSNCRCCLLPVIPDELTPEEVAAGRDMTEAVQESLFGDVDVIFGQGDVKHELITALSEMSGLSYEDVNRFVRQWAQTSNDTDMRSLAIQRDAAELFKRELSEWQKQQIAGLAVTREEAIQRRIQMYRESREEAEKIVFEFGDFNPLYKSTSQKDILQAMYDSTQKRLESVGLGENDWVTLYRGFSREERIIDAEGISLGKGDPIILRDGNALESWSTEWSTARGFVASPHGYVVKASVPRSQILGTCRTGFGCLGEYELVVFGDKPIDAQIMSIWGKRGWEQ